MTLILPQFSKMSLYHTSEMETIEGIAAYLKELDKDIQRLAVAMRPDKVSDLVDASTVATDAALAIHFRLDLTAAIGTNRLMGNPTNGRDGQKVIWEFVQPATGGLTVTFDTKWSFGTDIPSITLSTAANAIDFLGATYDSINDKWRVTAFVTGY